MEETKEKPADLLNDAKTQTIAQNPKKKRV